MARRIAPSSPGGDAIGPNPTDRGKAGSKRSLLVEGDGGPLSLVVAGANVHDTKLLEATLAAIVVEGPQPTDQAPQHLCLDKGYDNPTGHQAGCPRVSGPHTVLVRRSWIASARRPIRPDVGWWNEPCRGCPSAEDYLSVTTKRHPISWVFCNWPAGYCGTGSLAPYCFEIVTKPVGKSPVDLRVDLRLFPPWVCLFGAAGVMRASMGDAGGFLRYSSGRSGAFVLAQRCWGGGLWTARSLFMMGPRDRGRKRLSRVELLPEPGSESRFRIPPEPGAAAWWGEISWLPDHPGGPQVFSLELSAPEEPAS